MSGSRLASVLRMSEAASIGLHAVAILASSNNEVLMPTRELAERLNASETHLSKVLQRLVKAGILRARRGPGGGVEIARPLEEISLFDVYQAIDGPVEFSVCMLRDCECKPESCIFGRLLDSIQGQVTEYLSKTKLSEIENAFL